MMTADEDEDEDEDQHYHVVAEHRGSQSVFALRGIIRKRC